MTVCEIYKETQAMTDKEGIVNSILYWASDMYIQFCELFLEVKTEQCIPVGLQIILSKTMNWKPNKKIACSFDQNFMPGSKTK